MRHPDGASYNQLSQTKTLLPNQTLNQQIKFKLILNATRHIREARQVNIGLKNYFRRGIEGIVNDDRE